MTAGVREAEALDVAEGAPLLLVERIAWAQAGHPVEFARDLFRGDRTRVVMWTSELADVRLPPGLPAQLRCRTPAPGGLPGHRRDFGARVLPGRSAPSSSMSSSTAGTPTLSIFLRTGPSTSLASRNPPMPVKPVCS